MAPAASKKTVGRSSFRIRRWHDFPGCPGAGALEHLPDDLQTRYFRPVDSGFEVKKPIRRRWSSSRRTILASGRRFCASTEPSVATSWATSRRRFSGERCTSSHRHQRRLLAQESSVQPSPMHRCAPSCGTLRGGCGAAEVHRRHDLPPRRPDPHHLDETEIAGRTGCRASLPDARRQCVQPGRRGTTEVTFFCHSNSVIDRDRLDHRQRLTGHSPSARLRPCRGRQYRTVSSERIRYETVLQRWEREAGHDRNWQPRQRRALPGRPQKRNPARPRQGEIE